MHGVARWHGLLSRLLGVIAYDAKVYADLRILIGSIRRVGCDKVYIGLMYA
jgi:hypothetical protein